MSRKKKAGRPKGQRNYGPMQGSYTEQIVKVLKSRRRISVNALAREIGCSPSTVVRARQQWLEA